MSWFEDKKLTKKERIYVDLIGFCGYGLLVATSVIYIVHKWRKIQDMPEEELNGVIE